ncbi:hypothetical protein TNCV_3344241 [Trichonephila clavipes]|nr:hypothetical protein TNCV_3344241 [Trichonephila clavipes]
MVKQRDQHLADTHLSIIPWLQFEHHDNGKTRSVPLYGWSSMCSGHNECLLTSHRRATGYGNLNTEPQLTDENVTRAGTLFSKLLHQWEDFQTDRQSGFSTSA